MAHGVASFMLSGRCRAAWAHVRLARSETLLAFVATFIGAGVARADQPARIVIGLAVSNTLLAAASMMFNDCQDVEADRINRPDRPIPNGSVPRTRALGISVTLFLGGLLLALVPGLPFGLGAAAVIGLSVAYSCRLKGTPVLGHGVTALLWSYPLLCWAPVAQFESSPYITFLVGLVFASIGKEVVRTAADASGDAAAGIRTVATIRGARSANRIGSVIFAVAFAVGWLPILRGDAGVVYAGALTVGMFVALCIGPPRLDGPPRQSSRQLIVLARGITVLMTLAVTIDLLRAGWRPF